MCICVYQANKSHSHTAGSTWYIFAIHFIAYRRERLIQHHFELISEAFYLLQPFDYEQNNSNHNTHLVSEKNSIDYINMKMC